MRRAFSPAILILIPLAACATTPGGDGDSIRGIEWRAIEIAGQAPTGGSPPSLRLQRDRPLAGGSGGCNIWSADYDLVPGTPGTIALGDLTSTRRACPEPQMRDEAAFLTLLQQADRYILWPDGMLTLATPSGRTASFRRAPPDAD